jgi:uncharacterized membrane protein
VILSFVFFFLFLLLSFAKIVTTEVYTDCSGCDRREAIRRTRFAVGKVGKSRCV